MKTFVTRIGSTIGEYVDERFEGRRYVRWLMDRPQPKGINWFYTLGFTSLVLFMMQTVTGIILAMYFVPSTEPIPQATGQGAVTSIALESTRYINEEIFLGEVVRGMHFWGASGMIIVVFLHMLRVFFMGAYKYPRELTWVVGVLIFLVTLMFGLSGYLLPWGQKGYWSTAVAINVFASAPGGAIIGDILRGGPDLTSLTLSRFYSIHMLVLPATMLLLLAIHLFFVIRMGISAPPRRIPK